MTQASLKQIIVDSEAIFRRCWKTLEGIYAASLANPEAGNRLLSFQADLATAIRNLETAYNGLCLDKRKLIEKKHSAKATWFTARMRSIDRQQRLLTTTIDVGKAIGDSFAWFFYQNENDLLQKHAERPTIQHGLTGKGGIGEIAFVKRATRFGGYFVLSHSVSTFLRLGDVSFIDLSKMAVAGIGELKSHVEGNTVTVQVNIVGGTIDRSMLPPLKGLPTSNLPPPSLKLSPEAQGRLKRQLESLKEVFKPKDKSRTFQTGAEHKCEMTYKALETVFSASVYEAYPTAKAARSVVIGGFRNRGKSFFKCLTSTYAPVANKHLKRAFQTVQTIIDPSLSNNDMRIDWLNYPSRGRYQLMWGMRPVFWWPISMELKEAIVFKSFCVGTFFNSAFLINDLRASGLDVQTLPNGQIKVLKQLKHGRMELEGMHYFLKMIQCFLVPDLSVCALINALTKAVDNQDFKQSAKVKLAMNILYQ